MSRLTKLPADPAELKNLLGKLKDKEARLQADLAINEHPELEQAIIEIALCLHDVKKISDMIKVTERPTVDNSEKVMQIERMVKFYQSKIDALTAELESLKGGSDPKYIAMAKKKTEAVGILQRKYDEWADAFGDRDVDICQLIPDLVPFLKVAD